MGDNDLTKFPPDIKEFTHLTVVSTTFYCSVLLCVSFVYVCVLCVLCTVCTISNVLNYLFSVAGAQRQPNKGSPTRTCLLL